ncbi:hypothetical protein COBT_001978 [Conglomerata obtusa]
MNMSRNDMKKNIIDFKSTIKANENGSKKVLDKISTNFNKNALNMTEKPDSKYNKNVCGKPNEIKTTTSAKTSFSDQKIIANSFNFENKNMYSNYYNDDTVSGAIDKKQKKDFSLLSQKPNKQMQNAGKSKLKDINKEKSNAKKSVYKANAHFGQFDIKAFPIDYDNYEMAIDEKSRLQSTSNSKYKDENLNPSVPDKNINTEKIKGYGNNDTPSEAQSNIDYYPASDCWDCCECIGYVFICMLRCFCSLFENCEGD